MRLRVSSKELARVAEAHGFRHLATAIKAYSANSYIRFRRVIRKKTSFISTWVIGNEQLN